MEGKTVGIKEVLAARDARIERQRRLLEEGGVLIYLTMNIPGPVKTSGPVRIAFDEGVRRIRNECPDIQKTEVLLNDTGYEAAFLTRGSARMIKERMCALEDTWPLGRLWDMDVMTKTEAKLSRKDLGLPERQCLLCGRPAFECARSRRHTVEEMTGEIQRRIDVFVSESNTAEKSTDIGK